MTKSPGVFSKTNLVTKVTHLVHTKFEGEGSGHDWHHIDRVRNTAVALAIEEQAALEIVELGALLHDIADWKFTNGDEEAGPREARRILERLAADEATIEHVVEIVTTVSFKGAKVATPMRTIEGKCVQDADRLDALGALGIARCFAYGGHVGRPLYDPQETRVLHESSDAYKQSKSSSLAHFHEKLYLLGARMNTETGRRMAAARTGFMQTFEDQFLKEWSGQR